jgi:hypothetical protein
MNPKQQANFRLSNEAHRLLASLAKKLGITQTAVIEHAIRQLADTEKIKRR